MNAITPVPPVPPVAADDGIEIFSFGGHSIRIVRKDVDGKLEPWFVASDACAALKLSNASVSLKALDPDERAKKFLGGRQGDVLIISESGLFSLIMRCQKATVIGSTAHRFRKWVTKEVLPSIRETGSYGRPAVAPADALILLQDPATLIALLGTYAAKALALETENKGLTIDLACSTALVEHQAPIVEAYSELVEVGGALCVTDAAKAMGVKPSALYAHMRDRTVREPWIYTRAGGDEVAFQTRLDRRELEHKLISIRRSSGEEEIRTQVKVTSRGAFLLRMEMAEKERQRRRAAGEFDL